MPPRGWSNARRDELLFWLNAGASDATVMARMEIDRAVYERWIGKVKNEMTGRAKIRYPLSLRSDDDPSGLPGSYSAPGRTGVNAYDDDIVHDRTVMNRTGAEIMRRRGISKSQFDAIVARLVTEGRLQAERKARPKTAQPKPKKHATTKQHLPPTKLDGPAAYDQAAYWLAQWGVQVTWQRFRGEYVPEIEGRLTHVGELCERYFDERRKWAANCAASE